MGGQNSQEITLETTEYLDANKNIFEPYSTMPESFSRHCAKMINATHLFSTGGSKRPSSAHSHESLSRGKKD